MGAWLTQHRAALLSALRRLWAAPFNTLLSILAMGIALTLPAAGYVLLDNLREMGRNTGNPQISLFMELDADKKAVEAVQTRLQQSGLARWRFVPRDEALHRLQGEGMAEIIASLPRNPLPDAFIVEAAENVPESLEALRQNFSGWPGVAHVQLDSAWIRRFDAFLRLGNLMVTLLAGIFAAGLVAVTFNTIRLQVMAHAAEIEVSRLIGATSGFIRRPFYYFGALQGALGGLAAAGFVALGLRLIAGPVSEIARLYGGDTALRGLACSEAAILMAVGATLGWLGAQLSLSLSLLRRH